MHDNGHTHCFKAGITELRTARTCRRRQRAAANPRVVHARLLKDRAVAEKARTTSAALRPAPYILLKPACTILLFEFGADLRLKAQ